MRRIALNLKRLAATELQDEDLEEVIDRGPSPKVRNAPISPVYILSSSAPAKGSRPSRPPPPLPRKAHEPSPSMACPATPHVSMRVGVAPPEGMERSSILFLVTIALVVLAMSVVGLVLMMPASQWALLQG